MFRRLYIYLSCVYRKSYFVASDQFKQLSLLRNCHKVKAYLQCTDESQNRAETRIYTYLVTCKKHFIMTQ